MASDDQKKRPLGGQGASAYDALMAQALPAAQQPGRQFGGSQDYGEPAWRIENEPDYLSAGQDPRAYRGHESQIALLQSQLTQISQLRSESGASGAQPNAVAGEQYLVFSLLECECALKAEHIQGVERLVDVTPVPNVAPWVIGVINLRGSIASVVDLRSFLDMEQLPYNPRTRLLSVQYNEMVICLAVDSVSEMVPIPDSVITNILSTRQTIIPQWAVPYAYGSALLDRRVIVLLDAARLLFSDKMQRYEALE